MDKENFKKKFIARLIRHTIKTARFCDKLKLEKIPFCMINQLMGAISSIGANVVEANAAHSKKDYIKFFEIALKSANESKYWLLVVKELTVKNKEEAGEILNETIEIANILGSSVLTLKGKKK